VDNAASNKPRRTSHRQRQLVVLALAAVAAAALAVVVQTAVAPAVVRARIAAEISARSRGRFRVDRPGPVQFRYPGPIRVKGLRVVDRAGRLWLAAPEMRVWLSGLSPSVIEVEAPAFVLHIPEDAALGSAPSTQPATQPINPAADLDDDEPDHMAVRIVGGSVAVMCGQKQTMLWDEVTLSAEAVRGQVRVSFLGRNAAGSERVAAHGTVDRKGLAADLAIELNHVVKEDECGFLLRTLGVPLVRRAEGAISADLRLRGPLRQPEKLDAEGTVELSDWQVQAGSGMLAERLAAAIRFRGPRFETTRLAGDMLGGKLTGRLFREPRASGQFQYGGRLSFQEIDLARAAVVIGGSEATSRGRASGSYVFAADRLSGDDLSGRAMILLDDADLVAVPVISDLLRRLEPRPGLLSLSDGAVVFSHRGPRVRIEEGRLASAVGALEAEPGGEVNLDSGQVDAYVIIVPLNVVRQVLQALPVVKLFVSLKDRLTRLHVCGHVNQPPDQLIRPAVLADLRESTTDFFRTMAGTNGEFRREMYQRVTDLFEGKKPQ